MNALQENINSECWNLLLHFGRQVVRLKKPSEKLGKQVESINDYDHCLLRLLCTGDFSKPYLS